MGSTKTQDIAVCIIEDDQCIREGIADYLNSTENYSCKYVFESCEEALKNLSDNLPVVILMDISLKEKMTGIEGAAIFKQKYPSINIIMLTVYEDDEKIFSSLRAGASGYLLKKSPLEKIACCY